MKKITIAVWLMISLVIHPLSAQALPTTKSVDFSADLNRVYQDFGNPENGILIAAGKAAPETPSGKRGAVCILSREPEPGSIRNTRTTGSSSQTR